MHIMRKLRIAAVSILLVAPVAGLADSVSDATFQLVAEEYELPAIVLYAVACAESSEHNVKSANKPWPWTLTIAGERKHYPTRVAAQGALDRALELGISNIGVGLMQVNWRRYQGFLGDPSRALDPEHNLRIGARILRDQWNRTGDLWLAIGQYQSAPKIDAAAFRHHVGADVIRLLSQTTRFSTTNG